MENLLDMSRLQAGVLGVCSERIALEEIVPRALDDLGPRAAASGSASPMTCRRSLADPALLERILANLLSNAVRYSPPVSRS